jgi:hypothetical protein
MRRPASGWPSDTWVEPPLSSLHRRPPARQKPGFDRSRARRAGTSAAGRPSSCAAAGAAGAAPNAVTRAAPQARLSRCDGLGPRRARVRLGKAQRRAREDRQLQTSLADAKTAAQAGLAVRDPGFGSIEKRIARLLAHGLYIAADGDYRKVGNGTTTRALRFVSILKSHHSSNRSHQGHGKRRKASGRSCLSAFATACSTAGRTSSGICATAASSRYSEASARCLLAR